MCAVRQRRAETKLQRYCRKIYEMGYVPICPQVWISHHFLDEGEAEDQQAYNRMAHLDLKAVPDGGGLRTGGHRNDEYGISAPADRLHIICTTLDGLIKIKEINGQQYSILHGGVGWTIRCELVLQA